MNRKNDKYRVKIKIGDAEVDVEGAQSGVVKIVEALSDVLRGSRRPMPITASEPPPATPTPRDAPVDIRSFFEEKKPSSDVEASAVAAFYRQYLAPKEDRVDNIDSGFLQEAFRQAKRRLPARAIYTLTNARNAGYLDSGAGPGQFRLNPVGYNLVEHTLGTSKQADARPAKRTKRHRKSSSR